MNVPVKAFLMSDGGTLLGSLGMMVLVVVILVVQWCMLERLERRLRLQETHVGGIIHDLRSPLASVLMLLEAWRGRERDAAWQPLIDEGMKRVRTMAADIVRLLDATQLSHRRATLRWEQVDLAALVAALCEEYEQAYAAQPHTFRIENALPDGLTVRADRMLLTNVVRNLWENAMKYSDPGVCVTVCLTADGRHVRLSVADTGWGIRRSELRRVFALYYRSSHHGRKVKGFGIGLAKSRLSMKAMGGRLTVESREGEGSTFTVTLRRR
ncbi:MAG TPA: HAMP domain-containing histidine kinase [Candidatus Caccomonas pullistercoris]|nr:HAMP domain-containing histidine kinase [Candidatus Caccomonas pullistercoris]